MTSRESVLLVRVPEAEPVVHSHRLRLDPVTERGVPAHVTALFPFVAAHEIDDDVLDLVASVAARHPAFSYEFRTTGWFEDAALWLAPHDPLPFVRLTEALADAFPDHPAYGGEFDGITPHLTVARWTTRGELEAVERDLLAGLPVAGTASHLTLMTEGEDGSWSVAQDFSFAR